MRPDVQCSQLYRESDKMVRAFEGQKEGIHAFIHRCSVAVGSLATRL